MFKTETICITSIGYSKLCINVVDKGVDTPIFKLKQENNILPDVIVGRDKYNTSSKIIVGFHKKKKKTTYPGTKGAKIITFIDSAINKDKFVISKLFFSIAKATPFEINQDGYNLSREKYTNGIVRILLYDADTTKKAEKFINILPEDIICEIANKTHIFKVDILKYNIRLPEKGVYLGLEWLGEKNNDLVVDNITPNYFRSDKLNSKNLLSFFGNSFYDPSVKFNTVSKDVPNFGLELIKIE